MKMVLKVPTVCKNCKSCVLKAVSDIQGITSLTFDEEKSTLTVVGDVDVVVVATKLRKAHHPATVMTVVDEKKEAEDKKKKEEEEEKKKKKEEEEKKWKECGAMMQQCDKLYGPRSYCIAVDDRPSDPCTIM